MKKLLFLLLAGGAVAVSSCNWWDPYEPWDPVDPNDPPCDTVIDPWDPGDTNWWPDPPLDTTDRDGDGWPDGPGGNGGDTIIFDPFDPNDTNWWDPRDTSGAYERSGRQ